jgi:mRNA-degrading endonuclease RelE of RelBE toxin-antitoxin system
MAADVVLTDQARQDVLDLNNVVISARVKKLIDRLKKWPDVSGVKALSGNLAGKYRIRTGDYRIQFRVENQRLEKKTQTAGKGKGTTEFRRHRVIVEKVGHRDRFYES